MHGRTIATALAGTKPVNLEKLDNDNTGHYPQQNGTSIVHNLLDDGTNVIKNNSMIEGVSTILVSCSTLYQFNYALTPKEVQLPGCSTSTICYDCLYDLEITITDDADEHPPIIHRYSNVSATPDANCSPAPLLRDLSSTTTPPSNNFTFYETLQPGSYTVRKTLTVSEASLQKYKQDYLDKALISCEPLQTVITNLYNSYRTATGCLTPQPSTCTTCSTATLLTTKRELMLLDMMPFTGQYAVDPTITDPAEQVQNINVSQDMFGLYNIFSIYSPLGGDLRPYYKKPKAENGTVIPPYGTYNNYYGQPDPSIYTGVPVLADATAEQFTQLFKDKWAEALLPYHPEYAKLLYAEQNLATSYNWMNTFNQMTLAQATVTTTPPLPPAPTNNLFAYSIKILDNDPFYGIPDPIVSTAKTNMEEWVTQAKYKIIDRLNGQNTWVSMWQLAYGSVMCKSILNKTTMVYNMTHLPPYPGSDFYSSSSIPSDIPQPNANEKEQIWEAFKSFYQQERERQVNYLLANKRPLGDETKLVDQHYILHFPSSIDLLAQQASSVSNGGSADDWFWLPLATNSGTTPPVTPAIPATPSPCHNYIETWKNKLLECTQIKDHAQSATILNDLTWGMEEVCKRGTDAANPYGASDMPASAASVPSPYSTSGYRSFEEVVEKVLAHYLIDISTLCNPYVIEFPKPRGKNPVMYAEVTGLVDGCNCSQYAKLLTAMGNPGPSLAQVNAYLTANTNVYGGEQLTQGMYSGLQYCSQLGVQQCRGVAQALPPGEGSSSNPEPDPNLVPTEDAPNCYTPTQYILPNPEPLPAFLKCGFDATLAKTCYTCQEIGDLTATFRDYFNITTADAPDFTSTTLEAPAIAINVLYAKYLNYKTGMQYKWTYYAKELSDKGCNINLLPTTGDQPVVCRNLQPLTTPGSIFVQEDPCQKAYNMAVERATYLYELRRQQLLADMEAAYRSGCLNLTVAADKETFTVTYGTPEYHYTLYYYDQAGNLVKTVPPRGVNPDFTPAFTNQVHAARLAGTYTNTALLRPHSLTTNYRYNSLNQVVAQNTPDAGTSRFWYDKLGRLVVSQNAQQAIEHKFSYTLYDALGRIVEVGQKPNAPNPLDNPDTRNDNWPNIAPMLGGDNQQVTRTIYDVADNDGLASGLITQQNLRNRVSSVKVWDTYANFQAATYYTYDVHGNVNVLLQDYKGLASPSTSPIAEYKTITYNYDLVSGKVNKVAYQPGQPDAFYHRYAYDAENRITGVETSRDELEWEQDARYSYYRHGPLARTELGALRVQGMDYAYTLQGWLKGVNSTAISGAEGAACAAGSGMDILNVNNRNEFGIPLLYLARTEINFVNEFESNTGDAFEAEINPALPECAPMPTADMAYKNGDMGRDGDPAAAAIDNRNKTARDAVGFSLNYFSGDYTAIDNSKLPFAANMYNLPANGVGSITTNYTMAAPLYNGNIAAMMVSIPRLSNSGGTNGGGQVVYGYRYDQLNRIVGMNAYRGFNNATNTFTPATTQDYAERISYDPNGNILTYLRNGTTLSYGTPPSPHPLAMDNLVYDYPSTTNQLNHVDDNPAWNANYTEDIDDQNANNYAYDAIGNLIKDETSDITSVSWTVYGKIQSVTKTKNSVSSTTTYTYDGAGNRISKTAAGKTTVYVRDAQGNVMSVYEATSEYKQKELHLYGSSRIGMIADLDQNKITDISSGVTGYTVKLTTVARSRKVYELSNHLGNVLVTVTDRKVPVVNTAGNGIAYYTADVQTATDYAPFGMALVGRKVSSGKYRYGFNGQEKSDDVTEGNYTAEFWEYDSRIGRRWNVDPIVKEWESPYATLGGNPVLMIDPLGLDWYKDTKGSDKGQVRWYDGSDKRKGMSNVGSTYDGYTNENSGKRWMNGDASGQKTLWLDDVTVTAKKKTDNSMMESLLQVGNVTKASREAYNARPKPSYYDPNPLKTIFWDAGPGAFNPIKDVDVYVSANLKQKTDLKVFAPKTFSNYQPSTTVVWGGLQGGFTTQDGQGLYGNLVTGDVSYLALKIDATGTEIRGLPFRGLGVSLSSKKGAVYGEYSPQLRVLQDTKLKLYNIPIQVELGMGINQAPTIGLRGKLETPQILGFTGEVVGGFRASLQWPAIINALFK